MVRQFPILLIDLCVFFFFTLKRSLHHYSVLHSKDARIALILRTLRLSCVFGDDGTSIHIMSAGKSRLETNEARV